MDEQNTPEEEAHELHNLFELPIPKKITSSSAADEVLEDDVANVTAYIYALTEHYRPDLATDAKVKIFTTALKCMEMRRKFMMLPLGESSASSRSNSKAFTPYESDDDLADLPAFASYRN